MSDRLISIDIRSRKTIQAFRELISRGGSLARPMRVIATKLRNSVDRNFDAGGRYSSAGSIIGGDKKWKPVKQEPHYIVRRKYVSKKSGATSITSSRGKVIGSVLSRSTQLRRSIMRGSDDNQAWVSTNVVYAAIHNYGGKTGKHPIVAKLARALMFGGMFRRRVQHPGSNIPARPFMVVQPSDIRDFQNVLVNHLLRQK